MEINMGIIKKSLIKSHMLQQGGPKQGRGLALRRGQSWSQGLGKGRAGLQRTEQSGGKKKRKPKHSEKRSSQHCLSSIYNVLNICA